MTLRAVWAGAVVVGAATLVVAGCGGTTDQARLTEPLVPIAPVATVPSPDRSGDIAVASTTTAPLTAPSSPTTPPSSVPVGPPTTTLTPAVRSGDNVSISPVVGDPIAISIPDIGVASEIVATGVLDDGSVAVPPDADIAGWFAPGPRPGERGPAVIMGHVDSRTTGPGVFYRLRDLQVGAIATVETATGPIDFVVQSVEQYPKDEFPTALVYGPVPEPALRLITCGGSFDESTRHYRDNIVAFLTPVVTP